MKEEQALDLSANRLVVCDECHSLRRQVHELKQTVDTLVHQLSLFTSNHHHHPSPVLHPLPQSPLRKRAAIGDYRHHLSAIAAGAWSPLLWQPYWTAASSANVSSLAPPPPPPGTPSSDVQLIHHPSNNNHHHQCKPSPSSPSSADSSSSVHSTTINEQQQPPPPPITSVTTDSLTTTFANNYNSNTSTVIVDNKLLSPQQVPPRKRHSASRNITSGVEKKKQTPDDFVAELIERHKLMDDKIKQEFTIPVPEAVECDDGFKAVSEEQILLCAKWADMDSKDAVVRLTKKLAEKRVFGLALMAKSTVAGTNHSSYPNLPVEGILYIESVCRRVLFPQIASAEAFADVFRPAVRGLAARCRRIRHSLKSPPCAEQPLLMLPSSNENALSPSSPTSSSS